MKFTIKPLREYLDKHELSQKEFAAILGTTPENVCRWLAGDRIPSGLYLSMICFYTGLSATDFYKQYCQKKDGDIPMMKLRDTIELMTSDDYRERFAAEYWQLRIRWEKLSDLLNDWEEGKLDFEPICPRELLEKQVLYMYRYMEMLQERAEMEYVDLYHYTVEVD